jgi:carbon storage regulator
MLVLSRERTETLVIGSGIRITILKVDRNQVRLGIEAPADVPIFRAELLGKNSITGIPAPGVRSIPSKGAGL